MTSIERRNASIDHAMEWILRLHGHTTSALLAAGIALCSYSALPTKAGADNLSSFVAGVATGALLGGAVNPYHAPPPTYYYAPQPEVHYYYPQPRYVYVVPDGYEHHRWRHRWHDEGDD